MPNLGAAEIIAILVVALVVLGPKRLPEVGRKIGGFVRELRAHSDSVKKELRDVIDIDGVTDGVNSVRRDLKEAVNLGSVFSDADPALPRSAPTAPPLAGGDGGTGAAEVDGVEAINPMMRALGPGGTAGPAGADGAVTPPSGPTRRLPGAIAPSGGEPESAGAAASDVTRRLPASGDEA